MKVGILSLGWPPAWAGGETYLYRIFDALNNNGIDAWGITATKEDNNYDNGSSKVIRVVPPFAPDKVKDSMGIMFEDVDKRPLTYNEQIERMNIWSEMINTELKEDEFDIGIIYVENLTSINAIDYQKLFGKPFKKLISISFDFDYSTIINYEKNVTESENIISLLNKDKEVLLSHSKQDFRNLLSRHYNPEMEGIIHITDFNKKVVNTVFGEKEYEFVLHPLLENKWFDNFTPAKPFQEKMKPEEFVVGMINPIPKKGVPLMIEAIASTPFKFKILEGGHQSGELLLDTLSKTYNTVFRDKVELIHYVEDIVSYYDSIDVLFMPSWIEGYGQVAHEALIRGIPVITKRFPTIVEASVNAAKYIDPKDYENSEIWINALHEIYANQKLWQHRSSQAKEILKLRQDIETTQFIEFLDRMCKE